MKKRIVQRTLAYLFFFSCFSANGQIVSDHFVVAAMETGTLRTLCQTNDGHFLVGGDLDFFENDYRGPLIKLDSAGKLIADFIATDLKGYVYKASELPDKRILVGLNSWTSYPGVNRFSIAMLNADGSLDETFKVSNENVMDFNTQSDGKLIVAGLFDNYDGSGYSRLARLHPDGTVDDTFHHSGLPYYTGAPFAIDEDDNIFISLDSLIKLSKDGVIDQGFSQPAIHFDYYSKISTAPGGKLFVGGRTTNGNKPFSIIKLKEDGSIDNSFMLSLSPEYIRDIVIRKSGKILVTGNFSGEWFEELVELDSTGSVSRRTDIKTGYQMNCFEDRDGNAFAYSSFTRDDPANSSNVLRLTPELTIDENFAPSLSRIHQESLHGAVDHEGRLLVAGSLYFDGVDNVKQKLVRLNYDGTPDTTFKPSFSSENNGIYSLEKQGNKMLISGSVLFSDSRYRSFARISADGSIDPSFKSAVQGAQKVSSIDSLVYLGGMFKFDENTLLSEPVSVLDYNGNVLEGLQVTRLNVIHLNDMETQLDGKVVLIGDFKLEGSNEVHHMVRLNSDGSYDTALVTSLPAGHFLLDIEIDNDNKILIGGHFETFNGWDANSLIRLNTDLTLDESFDVSSAFALDYPIINSVKVLPDNNIAIGGGFESFGTRMDYGLAILDPSGNQTDFESGFHPNTSVRSLCYGSNTLYAFGRIVGEDNISAVGKVVYDFKESIGSLEATPGSDSTISITWQNEPEGGDSIIVAMSSNNHDFEDIAKLPRGTRAFEVNNLEELTHYYLSVRASNDFFQSVPLIDSTFTLIKDPVAYPAKEVKETSFVANWENIPSTEKYTLQISRDDFESFVQGYEHFETSESSHLVQNLDPGTYKYRLSRTRNSVTSGYSNDIEVNTLMVVSAEKNMALQFEVYPNPMKDVLVIKADAREVNFEIVSIDGILLGSFQAYQPGHYHVDTSLLKSGLYFLRIRQGNREQKIVKLIKH